MPVGVTQTTMDIFVKSLYLFVIDPSGRGEIGKRKGLKRTIAPFCVTPSLPKSFKHNNSLEDKTSAVSLVGATVIRHLCQTCDKHNSKMKTKDHIDLFAGIGGFGLAARECGLETTHFVECEEHLRKVLIKNWPDAKIHEDVKKFKPTTSPFLITGGFPCQDISRANKNERKGIQGERSSLWTEYHRVIRECRPRYVIIENVYDLLSSGLGVVVQNLAEVRYDSTWTVIDSQYCGTAQRRRRVYILGVRDGIASGSDIFTCSKRTRRRLDDYNLTEKRLKESLSHKEKGSPRFFSIQRTGEYRESGICSTIRKCGWANGGDIIVKADAARHLTAREKLILQGIPANHTEGCGLTKTQLHSANGMTVPAVVWILKQLLNYDKTLDI